MRAENVSFRARLAQLDSDLLAATVGQEAEIAAWLQARESAIAGLLADGPTLDELAEVQERTARLREKMLHWRRAAIMDLSLIEQHMQFLRQQVAPPDVPATRLNLSA
jgi:hypothetical protein